MSFIIFYWFSKHGYVFYWWTRSLIYLEIIVLSCTLDAGEALLSLSNVYLPFG